MIDIINSTRACNIVTIEDPIEFLHKHKKSTVRQRELGNDTHSFSAALRHVLRHDPDVIMIGEMRDTESIAIALTAAETGHLVLSTLHTQTAPLTITRIIDSFSSEKRMQVRHQLANSLRAVISQTLVPDIEGKGRIAAVEYMVDTPAIRSMIRDGKEHQIYSAIQTGHSYGMQTLDQALIKLYSANKISKNLSLNAALIVQKLRDIYRTDLSINSMKGDNPMAYYSYECLDKNGQLINGQISAEGISQAVDKLKRMGLSVIDLKENKPKEKQLFSNEKKPTITDLALFSRQLAAMLAAGIPVTRALLTLSQQAENIMLKEALETIHSNVEGGMNLTEAFSLYPHIFNDLYISMINAGETGGMLEASLLRLSEQLQKEKVLRDEVKSAISYPRTIAIFALVMFVAMVVFLVPVFQKFIPETSDIPAITQLIFNLSASWRNYYYIWIAAITAIVSGFILFAKSKTGRDLWEKNKFRRPVFGMLLLKTVIARFTRTLSTLLRGGITVVQALESAGPTSGSALVSETVKKTVQGIEEGRSIASTFEQSGLFPPMVTQMVAVGEESVPFLNCWRKLRSFMNRKFKLLPKDFRL